MPNSQPHSTSAQNNNSPRERRHWRLLEIVLWSVLGWFYWMAFMVLLVWAVAQVQVDSTLRAEPELVHHLYEYANIGRDWQPLSTTADVARPMLELLQSQESDLLMHELRQLLARVPLPSSFTLAAIETSLAAVVHVGDEMRDLSELRRTAEDIERYLAEPGAENLRTSMQSSADGAKALQQAQQDFKNLVTTAEPLVQGGDYVAATVANGLRTMTPTASAVGLEQPVVQFADYLEWLPKPAGALVKQAQQYSDRAAADTVLLYSIHEAIVTADLRETIYTYGIFRGFIRWFLKYVWWIDAVVAAAIIVRLLAAYSRLFSTTGRQTRPGYAATVPI